MLRYDDGGGDDGGGGGGGGDGDDDDDGGGDDGGGGGNDFHFKHLTALSSFSLVQLSNLSLHELKEKIRQGKHEGSNI